MARRWSAEEISRLRGMAGQCPRSTSQKSSSRVRCYGHDGAQASDFAQEEAKKREPARSRSQSGGNGPFGIRPTRLTVRAFGGLLLGSKQVRNQPNGGDHERRKRVARKAYTRHGSVSHRLATT
jgi:hypothetical protein